MNKLMEAGVAVHRESRLFFYSLASLVFIVGFSGVIFYGYKTFYIDKSEPSAKEYTSHYALIAEEKDNAYWRLIEKGAKEEANEQNSYIEYVAPEKADNAKMLQLLDRMIATDVDGIIVQGINDKRFTDLVHKGDEQGIPIVTIDTDVENSDRQVYIGTDNKKAGQQAGEQLIADTNGKQYIGVITGRFDAISQQERVEGFKQAIKRKQRIHLVDIKESAITETGASQATYSLMKQHPNITALFGTSALDGVGMVDGLEEIVPNKDIYTLAFDLLPKTEKLLRKGKINAVIVQYPRKMGYQSIQTMKRLQKGNGLNNKQYIGFDVFTKKDLQKKQQKKESDDENDS